LPKQLSGEGINAECLAFGRRDNPVLIKDGVYKIAARQFRAPQFLTCSAVKRYNLAVNSKIYGCR
jgi:hypothetical protein